MNGKAYNDATALNTAIGKLHPGDRVNVEVWSQGTKRLAQVTLGARPEAMQQQQFDQQSQ
jgi:S1-C subfamily serine protease